MACSLILIGCNTNDNSNEPELKEVCNWESIPYTDYESLDYNIVGSPSASGGLDGFNYVTVAEVSVYNADTESGTFSVEFSFTTLDDGTDKITKTLAISPGQTVNFEAEYDSDFSEDVKWSYNVIPDTKAVTKYKQEEVCEWV